MIAAADDDMSKEESEALRLGVRPINLSTHPYFAEGMLALLHVRRRALGQGKHAAPGSPEEVTRP